MIGRLLPFVVAVCLVGCDATATPTIASAAFSCDALGVRVSPASISILVGDSAVVTAAAPSCATLPVPFSVTWRSGNSAVASVDSLSGTVRALAVGNATVIAIVVGDTAVRGAAAVVVHPR